MIHKVKGVVLHHIKYKESSAVVHIYTDLYGRQAYLVNSIRGKKSKHPGNLLQPFTLLELEAYHKEGRDLQRLKEMFNYIPYRTIPFDVHKSSQVLFLAEVLYKVLQEEDPNMRLYEFLEHSLQLLDVSDEGMVNFHLLFLVQLTKYLGFYPENNYADERTCFDMRNGQFSEGSGIHPGFDMRNSQFSDESGIHTDFFDRKSSELLNRLLGSSFKELPQISVDQSTRVQFLADLMDYYRLHVHGFGTLKSLPVLNEIYKEEKEI